MGKIAPMRLSLPAPDIWYVSYRSNINPKRNDETRVRRGARRFKTEAAAKQFAQEVIRNGWSAIAGTITPHKPKKAVSSRQILNWIVFRRVILALTQLR